MMNQIHIQYYKTKYAEFIMGSYDGKLCMLDYRYRKMRDSVDSRLQAGGLPLKKIENNLFTT